MKKRNTFKKIAVLCLSIAFTLSAAACGEGLITTNSEKDMAQVIATVNIAEHDDFKGDGEYAAYADVIESMNKNILKRDLVAYFLNVGYTYINSYGYTYEQTFNTLMDTLVSRKIMVQYAMAYYFSTESDVYTVEGYNAYIESEQAKITDETEKKLYADHPEILTMKYFLTNGGKTAAEDTADYDRAVYSLKKMINNTLDSSEQNYITEEDDDDDDTSAESRTTPTGVGTETEDYYDVDYEIYTGRNAADSCGSYERLDGSTERSRRMAYNNFLANLSGNGLLGDKEDTTDFTKLDYYFVELASQLEQALINKYNDDLSETANAKLTQEYVEGQYNDLVETQKNSYTSDQSAFETAIGSVSDDSFVVYSPKEGFGFVYNILLPFSETQTQLLSTYKNDTGLKKEEVAAKRADLLEQVKGKDLRAAWFSKNEDNNYAYEAADGEKYYSGPEGSKERSKYLFFEDNLKNSEGENARYEPLKQYYGKYAYNGTVTKDEDGKYTCKPNEIGIDEFIDEMEGYLKYAGLAASGNLSSSYVTDGAYTIDEKGNFGDYSEFLYYEGSVDLGEEGRNDYFVEGTKSYTAVSVINELTFAYSTDTGLFNTYMGYTVSPYKTDYMTEFEYAAQYAIKKGAGTYVVCPTDYGWHVIYVSFVYDEGAVYTFNWEDVVNEKEGSFSYLYYESLKESTADSYTELMSTQILGEYKDSCSKLYKNRYKDLLGMDNN